jgi:hypothetical protein
MSKQSSRTVADEDARDRANQAYWARVRAEERAAEQRAALAAEAAARAAEAER